MLPVTAMLALALEEEHPEGTFPARQSGAGTRYGRAAPPVIVWNITNACNLACPHCYSSAKRNSPDDLDYARAMAVLDRLEEAGVRIVIFSGGEPLLRPELPELIKRAHDAGMMPCLSSNGTLLTPERARDLAKIGTKYVGISIDGLPEFNDAYRGGAGSFRAALDGLRNARDSGIKTGVRITISEKNEDQVHPLLDLAEREGIPRFYVSHLVYGGRGAGYARHDLAAARRRRFMQELFERALVMLKEGSRTDIVTGGNDADGPALLLFARERLGAEAEERMRELLLLRGGNSAGEKLLNIDHTGAVHPDQFWRSAELGRLPEMSLAEVLENPLARQLRKRERLLHGVCGQCDFRAMCRGSHRERSLAVSGELWGPDPACYLSREEVGAA